MFKPSTIKKIQTECLNVIDKGIDAAQDYPETDQEEFKQALRDLIERLESELDESYFQKPKEFWEP
jgi:hypothetical protein